ncbi:hypothetical protein [uncultured Neptuniibacter sp.]|uniref:hypothetical protein n=1 Tax=uncultured Neptuniibacter sp. TaxID=502143 RepID=UPI002615275C|nr:hypothetical protein [uncultured Neptuniibacter sp.]
MHSMEMAQEWHTQRLFSQYKGTERRRSIIDRRKDRDTRIQLDTTFGISRFKPNGRRASDIPLHVDLDLATEKINFYKLI